MKQIILAVLMTFSANANWGTLGELSNALGRMANSEIQAYKIEKNFKTIGESFEIASIVDTVESSTSSSCKYQEDSGLYFLGKYTLKFECSGSEVRVLKVKATIDEDVVTIKSYTVKY